MLHIKLSCLFEKLRWFDSFSPNFPMSCVFRILSLQFSIVTQINWLSIAFLYVYHFAPSLGVRFFCFITLSTSLSHITLCIPLLSLPSGDQVNIHSGHLLSPMWNTHPYHFYMFLSRIICATLIFSNYFLRLMFWTFLQLFSKNPCLYLTVLSLICNTLSRYHNCTVKCFPSLCKIFISLYIMKCVYSTVG